MPAPNPYTVVQTLAASPRPSGSEAEARAAAWADSKLREAGLEVTMDSFPTVRTYSWPYLLLFLAWIAAALLGPVQAWAGLALALVALILFALESNGTLLLTRLLARARSQNVLGIRPAQKEAKRRLLITAHIDSARAALLFHPRIVPFFRPLFLLLVAAVLAIVLGDLAQGLLGPRRAIWGLQLAGAGYVGLISLLFLHRELFYPFVPGANDNASGVAVLLAAAYQLPPLDHTEVWFVVTGSEETGMVGMAHLLRTYPFEKDRTWILNLDNVGIGPLCLATAEGILFPLKPPPEVIERVRPLAEELGIALRPYTAGLPTDNTVALAKGYRGISLMALNDRGLPVHWHWVTDRPEHVQPENLERAVRFVLRFARSLEEG